MNFPAPIQNLINSFSRLPGVGRKTAERFVFYLLKQDSSILKQFSENIYNLTNNNFTCPDCFNFSDREDVCPICRDQQRSKNIICVVEETHDLNVIESTGEYHGVFHVLGGKIDPPEGVTPDKLTINKLVERIQSGGISEVILALNPDLQGEGTIIHLKNILRPLNVKITLLARGLPMGSDIEYADEATLARALKGRREV